MWLSKEFSSDVFKLESQIYLCVPKVGKIIKRLINFFAKHSFYHFNDKHIFNWKKPPPVSLLHMLLGDVFTTVLSIYHADAKQTLPKPDEVLLCTEDTSICEVKYNSDVETKKSYMGLK